MRDIKFRGLAKDGIGWIYGVPSYDFKYVFNDHENTTKTCGVFPETIGEYTGLCCYLSSDIYEGDICKTDDHVIKYVIEYNKEYGCFCANIIPVKKKEDRIISAFFPLNMPFVEYNRLIVIGNIHQNPELLK